MLRLAREKILVNTQNLLRRLPPVVVIVFIAAGSGIFSVLRTMSIDYVLEALAFRQDSESACSGMGATQ